MDGVKISSREIKTLLKEGNIQKANEMLSHAFFMTGIVKKDRQIGRTMNFPTANISYPKEKFPLKRGVYETRVSIDDKTYKGITNYGARPTFDDETVVTETHLDGFSGDLYGKELTIEFIKYLRDIQKFDSVAALKEQLTKDIRRVREND
jgi:riboflavin kinase/FMN adenylyltransferase